MKRDSRLVSRNFRSTRRDSRLVLRNFRSMRREDEYEALFDYKGEYGFLIKIVY